MNEIEGKFKIKDVKSLKEELNKHTQLEEIIDEENYLFKIKDSWLRFRSSNNNYVFTYKGKNQSSQFNKRREIEFPIHYLVFSLAKNVLKNKYRKVRECYKIKTTNIHLDYVFNLGYFVEIEAKNEKVIDYWKDKLKIKTNSIKRQYFELIKEGF